MPETRIIKWQFVVFPLIGLILGFLVGGMIFLSSVHSSGLPTVGLDTANQTDNSDPPGSIPEAPSTGAIFVTFCLPSLLTLGFTVGGYLVAHKLTPQPARISPQEAIDAILAQAREDDTAQGS
nr:hypothetical protein [Anaerolineae bacterium]